MVLNAERKFGEKKEKTCNGRLRPLNIVNVEPTRRTLIRRLRDIRDVEAWAALVKFYGPLLSSYVLSLELPAREVPDVVQEIFKSLVMALPNFRYDPKRARFRTYLYRVTMNKVIDHVRRQANRNRVEKERCQKLGPNLMVEDEPTEDWHLAHQRRALELAMAELKDQFSPSAWTCFQQRYFEGRACAEIAAQLDIRPNSVAQNANRVLERVTDLAKQILKELEDE